MTDVEASGGAKCAGRAAQPAGQCAPPAPAPVPPPTGPLLANSNVPVQDAVADLMGVAEEAAATARTLFKGGSAALGLWRRWAARCTCTACALRSGACKPQWAPCRPPAAQQFRAAALDATAAPPCSTLLCCRRAGPGAGAGAHQRGGAGRGQRARRAARHPVRRRGQAPGAGAHSDWQTACLLVQQHVGCQVCRIPAHADGGRRRLRAASSRPRPCSAPRLPQAYASALRGLQKIQDAVAAFRGAPASPCLAACRANPAAAAALLSTLSGPLPACQLCTPALLPAPHSRRHGGQPEQRPAAAAGHPRRGVP